MAAITTGAFPKALETGVRKWTHMSYKEHAMECAKVFGPMLKSKQKYEETVEGTGFPMAPTKAEGDSVTYVGQNQGPTTRFTHTAYGLGFVITREARDDNQYPQLARARSNALGFAFRQTKETVFANILNRGFNSSYVGGDGKELLATDHPIAGGGTQSNELAVAADLTEAALEDVLIQIAQAKNNMGLRVNLRPQMLIVAPDNMFEADRLINSTLRPGTANNDKNVLMGKLPKGAFTYHYLDDADAWFVQTDAQDGLTGFQRVAFEVSRGRDDDTMNAKFIGYERYTGGWSDWRCIYGSPGA